MTLTTHPAASSLPGVATTRAAPRCRPARLRSGRWTAPGYWRAAPTASASRRWRRPRNAPSAPPPGCRSWLPTSSPRPRSGPRPSVGHGHVVARDRGGDEIPLEGPGRQGATAGILHKERAVPLRQRVDQPLRLARGGFLGVGLQLDRDPAEALAPGIPYPQGRRIRGAAHLVVDLAAVVRRGEGHAGLLWAGRSERRDPDATTTQVHGKTLGRAKTTAATHLLPVAHLRRRRGDALTSNSAAL